MTYNIFVSPTAENDIIIERQSRNVVETYRQETQIDIRDQPRVGSGENFIGIRALQR